MDRLRRRMDKLVSRPPEEDDEPAYGDEVSDDPFLGSMQDPTGLPLEGEQAESSRRHASEPVIRYAVTHRTTYDPKETSGRLRSIGSLSTPAARASSTPNQLGLTMIYSPPEPVLDLVFVHGLGGTSTETWSWERDPANFWPSWLENDTELSRTRILTYGYGAGLNSPYTTLSILDFAKDLLFRIRTYSSNTHQNAVSVGKLPIVFIVHSMGGLVAKKAYILGKNDRQYEDIIDSVSAIVFLATPHKGSQLAQTLNNILKVTPGASAKAYVAELEKNSTSLQDINEQFRNMCGSLELVSFYETLKTPIGAGIKKLIVDKDSALLEYPGETSSSLIADHHGMTKFRDPDDANFRNVTNVLRWLMKKILEKPATLFEPFVHSQGSLSAQTLTESSTVIEQSTEDRLKNMLGISEHPEDDLEYFAERTMQGSCQWLLRRKCFQDWAANTPNVPGMLWITGTPGSGKSTLASFIVKFLRTRSDTSNCHHHFFLAGNQTKRRYSYLLRSIAFQAALSSELFSSRLLELHKSTGITFSEQKTSVIWERIFEGILFRLPTEGTAFWVIDGLDEAEAPGDFLKLISRIRSAAQVNIALISRATKDLSRAFSDFLPTAVHDSITTSDTVGDIEDYVRLSVQKILPGDDPQDEMVQDIMSKSSGSFLWVKLALDRIRDNWYTKDDIKAALNELPVGMEPLYERMIDMVSQQPEKTRILATQILAWATCSFSPLEIPELEMALKPEFKDFVDLKRTAEEICGQFVVVNKSKVTLIHETARHFLLRGTSTLAATISEHESHMHAATVCMNFLSDAASWRRVFSSIQAAQQAKAPVSDRAAFDSYPFLYYALTSWTYHVSRAPGDSDEFLGSVLAFLEENCLLWINGVALTRDLRILTRAAQNLKAYVRRRNQKAAKRTPTSFAMARDGELGQWANDIIRLVGQFGANIADNPTAVYKHVVPFCPRDSIIAKTFSSVNHQSGFSVTGLSSHNWDDCLARLSLGDGRIASQLLCKDALFITLLATSGTMVIWRAETFEEAQRINHGEYVTKMACSKTANLVATAGFKTTRVWDITTGAELHRIPKERHHHTKALMFGEEDDEIIIGYDDCVVQCIDLTTETERWRFTAKEPDSQDFSCARGMAFSPDRSQLAVVFRGRPVVVWNVSKSPSTYIPPRRCVLAEDRLRSTTGGDAWNAPEVALWHPVTGHLVILYEDTKIVEWNIADDEQSVYDHTAARSMALSQDGNFLLTSDVHGTLSVWILSEYRLVYQMKYDELVIDLAFSPDGTRLYDLRGSFCNVWEPDALVRADSSTDRDDTHSAVDTITSEPVLNSVDDNTSRVPITSLACDSSGRFYCVGKEDGSVTIHSMADGQRVRKLANHSSSVSVIKLAWSASEKYLASVDDSGRIIVKRLEPPTPEKDRWAVFPVCDLRMESNAAVEYVLFSTREESLLVSSSSYTCVMSMKTKKEVCRAANAPPSGGTWLNHPRSNSTLIHIDGLAERQYSWKTLEPKYEAEEPDHDRQIPPPPPPRSIEHTVQIRDKWLVCHVRENTYQPGGAGGPRSNRCLELLDLSSVLANHSTNNNPATTTTTTTTTTTRRQNVIKGLATHVRQLVGCFEDRVVFVDHQFWLCTWEMEMAYIKHKRHFFLPKAWVSTVALKLMVLNRQGDLLCSRNGEVAIVRAGFRH